MDCTACGAELHTTDVVCPFCGTSQAVELANLRDLDPLLDADALHCPQGCGALHFIDLPSPLTMRVAHCTTCSGTLFPPDGLAIAMQRHTVRKIGFVLPPLPGPLKLRSAIRPLPAQCHCPSCNMAMTRQRVNPAIAIAVDSCPQHGDWIKAGDFERIANAYAFPQPAPPAAPAAPVDETEALARRIANILRNPGWLAACFAITIWLVILLAVLLRN